MDENRNGAFEKGAEQPPVGELVSRVVRNLQSIFRAEVRLAGVELKEKLRAGAMAGLMLAGAALFGLLAAECLVAACIIALAIVLPWWLAALVMAVLLGFMAGGAYLFGRLALEKIDPVPQQTAETLKDVLDTARTRSAG